MASLKQTCRHCPLQRGHQGEREGKGLAGHRRYEGVMPKGRVARWSK